MKIAKGILGGVMIICLLLLPMISEEQEFGKALIGLLTIVSVMLISAFGYQFITLNAHKFNKKEGNK